MTLFEGQLWSDVDYSNMINLQNLLKNNVKKIQILDYGCGEGIFTVALSYYGEMIGRENNGCAKVDWKSPQHQNTDNPLCRIKSVTVE